MSFWGDIFGDDFEEEARKAGNEWRDGTRALRDEFRDIMHEGRDVFRDAVDIIIPPESALGELIHEGRRAGDRNEDMLMNLIDAPNNLFYDEYDAEDKTHFDLADHLFIRVGPYTHHAIYVGHNQVIHYNIDASGISIHRASLSEFAEGQKVYCMKESASPLKYSRREAVKRAEARVGESRYNLLANNCENFVRWCRSGGEQWVWE